MYTLCYHVFMLFWLFLKFINKESNLIWINTAINSSLDIHMHEIDSIEIP